MNLWTFRYKKKATKSINVIKIKVERKYIYIHIYKFLTVFTRKSFEPNDFTIVTIRFVRILFDSPVNEVCSLKAFRLGLSE